MSEEHLKQRYAQLQHLEQQATQLQKQLQKIQEQAAEIDSIAESLGDFQNFNQGDHILIPLASGIFARATLEDSKELIVNIGGNVTLPKPVGSVQGMLREQVVELRNLEEELTGNLQHIVVQAGQIETEMQGLIEKDL